MTRISATGQDAAYRPLLEAMAAREALRDGQRQLDADGVEVGVSRQALDETLDAIDLTLAALAKVQS